MIKTVSNFAKLKYLFPIFVTFVGFGMVSYIRVNRMEKTLKVWTGRVPYSLDPMDYDALAHHICFRSVYLPLISDYRVGEITGQIAESWSTNADKSKWSFRIRKGLLFSDGSIITPNEIALSLNRAALLMKKSNSVSGLLENLRGFENLRRADELIEGIKVSEESISLFFDKPMPWLLEKVSFGIYGIVSHKNFDPETGEWLDKHKIVSSGPYEVEFWNSQKLVIKLRESFPRILLLSKPINRVEFSFDFSFIESADLIVDFDDSLSIPDGFKFYGPVKSAIRYIECEGWNRPESACHNMGFRRKLRSEFYWTLDILGFETINSFFPLAIKGTSAFAVEPRDRANSILPHVSELKIGEVATGYKSERNQLKLTPQEAFYSAMTEIGRLNKIKVTTIPGAAKLSQSKPVDLRFRMTAILVDSPKSDISFMFNSEHGIKLPDQNGSIRKYIKDDNFSVQLVNEMLWDQAIIWPIGHMALGVWIKHGTVNLSSYNLILPPLDLQQIEWN
jgi:hypothetical protein